MPGMIWVGTLQELPLAYLWLWPAFRAINPSYEDAAVISGASVWYLTRRITLPLLAPVIFAAWLICFIFALGALSVPLLLGLPAGILLYSTEIYLATTRFPSDLNLASAYCLLFLAVTIFGVWLYRRSMADASRFVTITGKGYRPAKIRLGKWGPAVTAFTAFVLTCIAGLPILVLVWNSLMPYPQAPSIESIGRITFQNFPAALNYGPAQRAVLNSLGLGLAAGLITTFLGAIIAWYFMRTHHPRISAVLDQLATAPVAFPGILVGVSLLWLYIMVPLPIYGTAWILLIAYITDVYKRQSFHCRDQAA